MNLVSKTLKKSPDSNVYIKKYAKNTDGVSSCLHQIFQHFLVFIYNLFDPTFSRGFSNDWVHLGLLTYDINGVCKYVKPL